MSGPTAFLWFALMAVTVLILVIIASCDGNWRKR